MGVYYRFTCQKYAPIRQGGRGDRAVLPDWNEAGKTKIPDPSVGLGCPYYFPTPFCQDLHPVRRSDCHKKPDDVLP